MCRYSLFVVHETGLLLGGWHFLELIDSIDLGFRGVIVLLMDIAVVAMLMSFKINFFKGE